MKLLIDIPDSMYEHIDDIQNGSFTAGKLLEYVSMGRRVEQRKRRWTLDETSFCVGGILMMAVAVLAYALMHI